MRSLSHDPPCFLVTLERPYDFVSPFDGDEFALMLVSYDPLIGAAMMDDVADAIVASGCRVACCAGRDGPKWSLVINFACNRTDPDGTPPDDRWVMTSDHEEPLSEAMVFFRGCSWIDDEFASRFLIVLLSADADHEAEVVRVAREHFGG